MAASCSDSPEVGVDPRQPPGQLDQDGAGVEPDRPDQHGQQGRPGEDGAGGQQRAGQRAGRARPGRDLQVVPGPALGDGHDPTGSRVWTLAATVFRKSTTRGPQREATSSSSSTTPPDLTAVELVPAGPGGDGLGRLAAALGVGQEDQVGVGLDHVLGRQLRVAAGVLVGRVGDVLQAELVVELADEGLGGRRVQGLVQLVVVGQRPLGPAGGGDLLDLGAHGRGELAGLGLVAGGLAELVELGVGVVQDRGRRLQQDRDAELAEAGRQLAGVVGVDDQVGLVAGDGLDVRLVGRQVGLGRLLRVVGVAVDGHDLVAGADGEQHLGRGRRQRHDPLGPLVEHDLAAGAVQGDRERGPCPAGAAASDVDPSWPQPATTRATSSTRGTRNLLIHPPLGRRMRGL